jgi:hypothetical protein
MGGVSLQKLYLYRSNRECISLVYENQGMKLATTGYFVKVDYHPGATKNELINKWILNYILHSGRNWEVHGMQPKGVS